MTAKTACLLCGIDALTEPLGLRFRSIKCGACGTYAVGGSAALHLPSLSAAYLEELKRFVGAAPEGALPVLRRAAIGGEQAGALTTEYVPWSEAQSRLR